MRSPAETPPPSPDSPSTLLPAAPQADAGPRAGTQPASTDEARSPRSPRSRRLEAAARLLGDESNEVRAALLGEFRRAGKIGRPLLEAASRSEEPRTRSHARALLDTLDRDAVLRRLLRYAARPDLDFETAYFLLSQLDRPDFDARPYRSALNAMARRIEQRTAHLRDDLQRAQTLVKYLGTELGFRGDVESYAQPDNLFLHRVIERKQGLPLSLCALYSFVAKRCGLMTGIIPLPGHVMLRLYGKHQNLIVDPFHGGESRSQDELIDYLRDHGLRFNPVWMHDAGARPLFRRQVANLQNSWRSVGQRGRARTLDPLLRLLGR